MSTLTLRGTVTEVDAENAEFTVSFGSEEIQVDTDALSYNPLDDVGFQQIGKGDYVSISGFMNWEFFDGQVFEATSVTTLIDEEPS